MKQIQKSMYVRGFQYEKDYNYLEYVMTKAVENTKGQAKYLARKYHF